MRVYESTMTRGFKLLSIFHIVFWVRTVSNWSQHLLGLPPMWKKTVSGDASPLSKEEDEADEAEADEGDEAVSSVLRGRGFSLGMVISG